MRGGSNKATSRKKTVTVALSFASIIKPRAALVFLLWQLLHIYPLQYIQIKPLFLKDEISGEVQL
jgi:hypothetical protein